MKGSIAQSFARLLILTALFALAFGLRLYRLDNAPLRGDEAFAVRYWAAPPADVLRGDMLEWEPHPFGTFLGFWAWKSAAGDSEFAMRYLPLLGNLIGAAAVAALARRLFHDWRVAYLAALLWAFNPFLIWHAQDVRNYALWAGLSPLAMGLFLRAIDHNRPRDWALYVLAELLALHAFFLEALVLVAQGVYLLLLRRSAPVLRRAVYAWAVLAVLLIPWFVQLGVLAGSDYQGTTEPFSLSRLVDWVFPSLLVGDELVGSWSVLFYLAWVAIIAGWFSLRRSPAARLLLPWLLIPVMLWLVAVTRMDIFNPRYLIGLTPALLLVVTAPMVLSRGATRWAAWIGGSVIVLLGVNTLAGYYRGDQPKVGDWPALAAYLGARAQPGDLIVQTMADPAFGYYYRGEADETSLVADAPVAGQLIAQLNFYRTIWLVGRSGDAEQYLGEHLQQISADDSIPGHSIRQYRRWAVSEQEIKTPVDVTFGDLVRLRGFTLQGPDSGSRAMTLLLYWEPIRTSDTEYTVFVHLIGPPRPDTGSPLWDQDDHPPQYGAVSTLSWMAGDLLRDPYHLLDDPAVTLVPADYTIAVGWYDPATNERLPVFDANSDEMGDSYALVTLPAP